MRASIEGRSRVSGLLGAEGDQVGREIDDLLQVLVTHPEQATQDARPTSRIPDVGHGHSQIDVAHPLPTHLGTGHLDAATRTRCP